MIKFFDNWWETWTIFRDIAKVHELDYINSLQRDTSLFWQYIGEYPRGVARGFSLSDKAYHRMMLLKGPHAATIWNLRTKAD